MDGLGKNSVRFNARALTCLLTIFDGPKLLKKIVKYLQSTLADNLCLVPNNLKVLLEDKLDSESNTA